jgi:hypothetical protein
MTSGEQKLLFVRGFNTYMNNKLTKNAYIPFDNVFLSSNIKCKYFDYNVKEDLEIVYKRLCNEIEDNLYDIYCGHSMGGGLLMKYCLEHPEMNKCKQHKIILLMPLIHINYYIYKIANIVPDWIQLPKPLILPNKFLFEMGNILNDHYYLIPIKQVKQMYKFSSDFRINMLRNNILQNDNFHLFYARSEMFNFIPQEILDKITNLHEVDGHHECFNENSNSNEFFKLFLSVIDKPITIKE